MKRVKDPDGSIAARCERIEERRRETGISVHQLAEAVGVRDPVMWRMVKGAAHIPDDKLPRIADALGVTVEWLNIGENPEVVKALSIGIAEAMIRKGGSLEAAWRGLKTLEDEGYEVVKKTPSATRLDALLLTMCMTMITQGPKLEELFASGTELVAAFKEALRSNGFDIKEMTGE